MSDYLTPEEVEYMLDLLSKWDNVALFGVGELAKLAATLRTYAKVAEAALIIQGYEDFESNFGKLGADLDAALAALEGGED